MPPKQRITREMILEKAFDMFCCDGMEAVNARSVAKAMNCSTQPIFSYFVGMQDLRDALDQKAQEMFAERVLCVKPSGAWLVDVFAAYVRFAREMPHVFGHLYEGFHRDRSRMAAYEEMRAALVAHIMQTEGLEQAQAAELCETTMTYVCGLAALSVVGSVSESDVRAKIERVYRAYRAAM